MVKMVKGRGGLKRRTKTRCASEKMNDKKMQFKNAHSFPKYGAAASASKTPVSSRSLFDSVEIESDDDDTSSSFKTESKNDMKSSAPPLDQQ